MTQDDNEIGGPQEILGQGARFMLCGAMYWIVPTFIKLGWPQRQIDKNKNLTSAGVEPGPCGSRLDSQAKTLKDWKSHKLPHSFGNLSFSTEIFFSKLDIEIKEQFKAEPLVLTNDF